MDAYLLICCCSVNIGRSTAKTNPATIKQHKKIVKEDKIIFIHLHLPLINISNKTPATRREDNKIIHKYQYCTNAIVIKGSDIPNPLKIGINCGAQCTNIMATQAIYNPSLPNKRMVINFGGPFLSCCLNPLFPIINRHP